MCLRLKSEKFYWYWTRSTSCASLKNSDLHVGVILFVVSVVAAQLIRCEILMGQLYLALSLPSIILVFWWCLIRGVVSPTTRYPLIISEDVVSGNLGYRMEVST